MCLEDDYPVAPVAIAIARAFPLFSKKTKSSSGKKKTTAKVIPNAQTDARDDDDNGSNTSIEAGEEGSDDAGNGNDNADVDDGKVIHVTFLDSHHKIIKNAIQIEAAKVAADGVRLACRLVDTHPEELTTTAYSTEVATLFENEEAVTIEEIVGEELKERGYGGIYNVGKGATEPPRLIILTYQPPPSLPMMEETNSSITLIGKGIVYDTGGLAIKSRAGMCGMKHDMGGSAGVLGGFWAAVQLRTPCKIRLLLCLVG
jgi:leucyl aminopeptidase